MPHAATAMGTLADSAEARWAARRMVALAAWQALARAVSWIAVWHARRRIENAVTALSSLSDRMLRDIGVRRSEISRIVRSGRDASRILG